MEKICFIIAMHAEAQPLIERYGLQHIQDFFGDLPTELYRGVINGKELNIVLNGRMNGLDLIGCEAATLTTEAAISRLHPDILINAGTCGAFKSKGANIADVYLSNGPVMFHDRRVGDEGGWHEMGIGNYPTMDARQMARDLELKLGKCTTGSSLDMTDTDLKIILREGGELKDMEAGAIAFVASLHKVPLICVKSVTDLVDGGRATEEEFHENLHRSSVALKEACTKIVQYLMMDQAELF